MGRGAKGCFRPGGRSAGGESVKKTATAKPARIGPLDHLLINAVVDARQGVDGALDEDELHAAVDEFVNLNGRRHQSHYHAGFRDAIFNRSTAELPADNATGRRWYWTGTILGWARTERWQSIVQALDENEIVRSLGDGADAASLSAGLQVAKALWKTDRTPELATFVGKALAQAPEVFRLLLDAGTEALRSDEAGIARQVFELLMDCTKEPRVCEGASDVVAIAQMMSTVRRRMAHCLRLLGEHRGAVELLQGLLEDGPSANTQAMVHADIGLLKGHFLLLDEVRIPAERNARQDIVDRIRAGESDFRSSAGVDKAAYAAHGHYCLGVLALADDEAGETRYETAHHHLDRARTHFKSARAEYPPSLVAQADLYLGLAKAQLLTAPDIEHAGRLVAEGLRSGAQMPMHLVRHTVDALSISKSVIAEVASLLLEADNDEALDALAESTPSLELRLVAEKLYERAHRPAHSRTDRAKDLRRALHWFLRLDGHMERSSDVLDELEALAASGVAVDEFIMLLGDSQGYDPAWTNDDAAIAVARCLEARGDYTAALEAVRPVFHRYMSANDLDDAVALLDWVRTLGLDDETYLDLEGRYSAAEQSAVNTQRAAEQVTVLVVGGDESHAKSNKGVAKQVRKLDAAVSVEFIAIDWTAKWNTTLEDVRRKLPDVDAVVLMRFVRTTFGQHVRKLCSTYGVQWRFCYSGGTGARVRAVLRAAAAARGTLPSN